MLSRLDNKEHTIADMIGQIHLAVKTASAYPKGHVVAEEIINFSYEKLSDFLDTQSMFPVCVLGNRLMVNDTLVNAKNDSISIFADDLTRRKIGSITFYRGLPQEDFMTFLDAMTQRPNILSENGGVAAILKRHDISKIKVNNIKIINYLNGEQDKILGGDLQPKRNFEKNPDNFGALVEEKTIDESSSRSAPKNIEKIHNQELDFSHDDENGGFKNHLENLLSTGTNDDVEPLLKDIFDKLDDTSLKIREKVLENFHEITSTLEEFDQLKNNFRGITNALIKRTKQERNVDLYLLCSENLHRVCASQNRMNNYLGEETVGNRLFEVEAVSKPQLQKALTARMKNGRSLQYNLAKLDFVDEAVLTDTLAQQFNNCRTAVFSKIDYIPDVVLRAIPPKYVRHYSVLPFELNSGQLSTAMMKPDDLDALNDLRFTTGYSVVPHLASEYHLSEAIMNYYSINVDYSEVDKENGIGKYPEEESVEFVERNEEEIFTSEELKDSDAPVIRLVNLILKEAITKKASDIHIEPYENELRVRLRIDGALRTIFKPSFRYRYVVPSRLKVMAKLDIAERRLPQDGRFKVRTDGKYVDFRVSTFPGIYGEKVAMRLLNNSDLAPGIQNLGLKRNDLTTLLNTMHKSKGMILATGPTGSGKTTTLYSILHDINDGLRNISTVEDPVEYNMKGVNQFQVHPEIGLDFPRALRALLRQDPDILMIGEIRDGVTAEIAMQSALTGHLVLTTLHTNSAAETITRLIDMNIETYLISTCISLIVAQRLLRKICQNCRVEATVTDIQREILKDNGFYSSKYELFRGEGCDKCNNTGYGGRIVIYELLSMRDEIRELISKGTSSLEIANKAETLGLVPLKREGFRKVKEGLTSIEEWIRTVL